MQDPERDMHVLAQLKVTDTNLPVATDYGGGVSRPGGEPEIRIMAPESLLTASHLDPLRRRWAALECGGALYVK